MLRLEWLGAALGMLGSLLIALRIPPVFGFLAFLISNVAWIIYARRKGLRGLLTQQVFFVGTSLLGLWNWLVGPWVLG